MLCDLAAAALLWRPELARRRRSIGARVALSGESRGALLLDWYGPPSGSGIWLVEELDLEQMLLDCSVLWL